MEPFTLIVGGLVFLAGFLAGKFNRRRPVAEQSAVCSGCGHGLSYRDKATGHCTATVRRDSKYNDAGSTIGFSYVPCTCQSHTGLDQLLLEVATWTPASQPSLDQKPSG